MVYICEAHAKDTWPLKWKVEWETPKSREQRQNYAKICSDELGLVPTFSTVVVDDMDNKFNSDFGAWPTAYYVIGEDARLLYIGEPEEDSAGYDINLMFNFLMKWKKG